MTHKTICPCPVCTPKGTGAAVLGCLAIAAGGAAVASHAIASPEVAALGRAILDVCGAFCGLVTVLVVGVAWRSGLVARASAGVMWTCTQVWRINAHTGRRAIGRAQARALARARRPVAELAQGPGVGSARVTVVAIVVEGEPAGDFQVNRLSSEPATLEWPAAAVTRHDGPGI